MDPVTLTIISVVWGSVIAVTNLTMCAMQTHAAIKKYMDEPVNHHVDGVDYHNPPPINDHDAIPLKETKLSGHLTDHHHHHNHH